MDVSETPFRSGFVALLGRPNVGKSTLVNRLVGAEVSIATRKPQTTRSRILGIANGDACQLVFVDTPGIHHPVKATPASRRMNKTASAGAEGVDVVLLVITCEGWRDDDERVLAVAQQAGAPVILVINKIDRLKDKSRLLPLIEAAAARHPFAEVVPLSALNGHNLERLQPLLLERMPVAPRNFPGDCNSDRTRRFIASELLREQLFHHLGQELPYVVEVEIRSLSEDSGRVSVDALVWVNKRSQQPIVVGRGGERIKSIGTRARKKMELQFNAPVYLSTRVKVREDPARGARPGEPRA